MSWIKNFGFKVKDKLSHPEGTTSIRKRTNYQSYFEYATQERVILSTESAYSNTTLLKYSEDSHDLVRANLKITKIEQGIVEKKI